MKKLFILRGAMGSGKSTFIKENNLEDYTLSTDTIRLMFNSCVMTTNYVDMIPQFNNKKVWESVFYLLEERMKKGELSIIDAMHVNRDNLKVYKKLAERYRYRLYIVDFTDISLEELIDRNNKREETRRVLDSTIKRVYKDLNKEKVPSGYKIIKPEEFKSVVTTKPKVLDKYKKVHIFGDIHGCIEPLKKYFDKNGIHEDEYYIFTGDYFDRGLNNLEVFEFLKDLTDKNNFIFLMGNHEDRLYKYACDDMYNLDYSLMKTIEEFNEKISKSEIRGLIKKFSQITYISYNNKNYLISHGGVPYIPNKELDFYSTNSFVYGVDKYETNIDELYDNYMKKQDKKIYQVHGHRNYFKIEADKYKYSINLDGDIENGGNLRILILTNDEKRIEQIKNDNYDEKLNERQKVFDLINNFRNSDYIYEKELTNEISSFNFTKRAFYNKVWNHQTIKARGLFIDKVNYLVIARSYDKFFNIDERDDTKYSFIKTNLNYPVKFYLKYNGFLGILSVYKGELIFATKKELFGKYNEYFKDVFYKVFNDKQVKNIKERLIKNNTSMVFEVIDFVNDKHIIKYDSDYLILLDEIKNSINYEKEDYDKLLVFANKNNIMIKDLAYTINSEEEFEKLFQTIDADDYKYNDKYIEGFVIEDFSGKMVKYKTKYYNKWKKLRGIMEKALEKNKFKSKSDDKEELEFLKYLENKYSNNNYDNDKINIIDEREEFKGGN